MSLIDAYFAGIMDADGCITIIRAKRGNTFRHVLRTEVSMCHRGVIQLMKQTYGGTTVFRPLANKLLKNPNEIGIRDIYMWIASAQLAASCIRRILPYLVVKREEALIALEFQEGIQKPGIGLRLSETEIKRRDQLAKACSDLKRQRYARSI